MLTTTHLITVSPEILSGMPVFTGTRVPVKTLFDHSEAGDSLDVFLDDFPSVSREMAVAALEQAELMRRHYAENPDEILPDVLDDVFEETP